MLRNLALLSLLLAGFILAPDAKAGICADEVCAELFESNGAAYLQLSSSNPQAKAAGIAPILVDGTGSPEDPRHFIDAFTGSGFGCTGGLAPSGGTPATPGAGTSTSMACSIQNSRGDLWRISIVITWFWNADLGQWEVGNIEANAKLIKASFQNQVQ